MKLTSLPDGSYKAELPELQCSECESVTITPSHIAQMRNWALDCEWLDSDDISDMTPAQIIRGVNRHFDGGLTAFLSTCN